MIVNAIPRANISESIRCRIYYDLSLLRSLSAGLKDGLAPAGMDEGALGGLALATAGHPAGVPTIHRCQLGPLYPSLAFPMPPPSPMTFIADRHSSIYANKLDRGPSDRSQFFR